jgi:hypothetical protein
MCEIVNKIKKFVNKLQHYHGYLSYSMEMSPSWGATSCAATQELPDIL